MSITRKRIVILAGDVDSRPYVVRALEAEHEVLRVVIEDKEPRGMFLRRRAKRLGWWVVFGQVLFMLIAVPVLRWFGKKRAATLKARYGFAGTTLDPALVTRVSSVNAPETEALLRELQPDAIVLHGTRIVKRRILEATEAVVLNIHAGMTPMFRGVHGGYWALQSGHPELFGVTLHKVDSGIDTGEVVAQKVCEYTTQDNFTTYPLIQLGEGLALLRTALVQEGIETYTPDALFSQVWYHPTLWGYVWDSVRHGVR